MPERIGKYQILERIGRGGMGTIFKAHDPVLDRPVAVKVISSEVEVTDELRARFFREAQACARMSHPNIVTVYDMGEDDGRLFIVMELLDGEELRRLIAQRRALALEDKLAIVMQVCDGLHYAHEKGVVHRDIKPGNIFLGRNGQVKILDFGIAQIANTEGGLTRTGLIMGTLRYIAPEQVRGRADYRSDMYSVGAVFYEFLSLRPPFLGEDPMHLLEQLRTEVPPPLNELDAGIPAELAAIVDRAMRKEPSERFADLEQMRMELEQVQQGLAEEAQLVRQRVREQRERLQDLQTALGARLGPLKEPEPVPVIEDRARLATMRALEQDLGARIEVLRAKMARADAATEAMQRGAELLEAGQFADAVEEFEAIVAELPEHARAREALEEARVKAEQDRRRQLAVKVVQDARAALAEDACTLCLEILKQAMEIPPPAEVADEIAVLRQSAEMRLAALEEVRRARQEAERAREQTARGRERARTAEAARYARELWDAAEAKCAEAEGIFSEQSPGAALGVFNEAAALYRQAESMGAARQRERLRAEEARGQATRARQGAADAAAEQYAPALWAEASSKSVEAQAALARGHDAVAAEALEDAVGLYRRAESQASEARRRQREQAERARVEVTQARQAAGAQTSVLYAPGQWNDAEAKEAEAQAAFGRESYAEAGSLFEAAAAAFRNAEDAAREAQRQERKAAERARKQTAGERERARTAGAPQHARELWEAAEARSAEAEAAFGKQSVGPAIGMFDEATALYRQGETVGAARQRERRRAEEVRDQATQARQNAAVADAERYAPALWAEASATSTEGQAALDRGDDAAAAKALVAAAGLYRQAETRARDAHDREREQAQQGRQAITARRRGALAADAPAHASAEWNEAETGLASGEAAFERRAYVEASRAFEAAITLYRWAEERARDVVQAREVVRAEAEKGREAASLARRGAAEAQAAEYAAEAWHVAASAEAQAVEASNRQEHSAARALFTEARRRYAAATQAARIALEAESRRADAMLGDARRLLASDDVTAALRRLTDVLTLRPDHAGAKALRLEVEARLRESEAAACHAAGATLDGIADREQPADVPEQTILQGETADGVAHTNPVTADAPTVLAQTAPVVPSVETGDERDDATRIASSVYGSTPSRRAVGDAFRGAGARRPEGEAPGDLWHRSARSRQTADGKPWLLTASGILVTLGGLAAVATGILYFMLPVTRSPSIPPPRASPAPDKTSPSVRPAAPPVERDAAETLRKEVAATREEATRVDAERLAPAQFAAATEKTRDGDVALGRFDMPNAQQAYRAAIEAYGVAKTEAIRVAAVTQKEADLGAVKARTVEARRAAEVAEAPTLAQTLWAKAGTAQRTAEDAVTQGSFDRALMFFGDAEKAYRDAEKAAIQSLADAERARVEQRRRDLADVEQARAAATTSRREAERTTALRLAPKTFAAAKQKETEAEASLSRQDLAAAKARFQEAQQGYRQALQEAAAEQQRLVALRTEVEQARDRMGGARHTAEQTGAAQYAPKLLAAAQAKERDGQAALGRSEFGPALRLFGEAQSDYQSAAVEAKAESERQVAGLKSSAEQGRARMTARRDGAVKAGADKLAKDLFDTAQAKQAEADGLLRNQNFALASYAYQDAADRYTDATHRAREVREMRDARAQADSAKARMLDQKQQANPVVPEFGAGVAEEAQANSLYGRSAYRDATDKFRSAESLFARAARKQPPPGPEAPPRPASRRPPPPSF